MVFEFSVLNHKAIEACLRNTELFKKKKDKITIETETFATAYALSVVCKPLAEASIEFEREDTPTISIILPFLHQMETRLEKESVFGIAKKVCDILELDEEEDNEFLMIERYVQAVVDCVRKEVKGLSKTYRDRFLATLDKATYLDPR